MKLRHGQFQYTTRWVYRKEIYDEKPFITGNLLYHIIHKLYLPQSLTVIKRIITDKECARKKCTCKNI